MKTIAFIGANGLLGKPVARQLILAGHTVIPVGRHTEELRALYPEQEVRHADLKDPASLATALAGCDAVYLNLSVKPGEKPDGFHTEAEGLDNLIAAAKIAGIQRIGYLSSLVMNYQGMDGFHWWVFDLKIRAVQKIQASGIPSFIFRPSTFMDNVTGPYRQGNKMQLAGKSLHKMYAIAGEDYGHMVARAFEVVPAHESRDYWVQGKEGFTADGMVVEFLRYYTKEKLGVARVPIGLLKVLGLFLPVMHYVYHILTALNNYPEPFGNEARHTWAELGEPQLSMRQFTERLNG